MRSRPKPGVRLASGAYPGSASHGAGYPESGCIPGGCGSHARRRPTCRKARWAGDAMPRIRLPRALARYGFNPFRVGRVSCPGTQGTPRWVDPGRSLFVFNAFGVQQPFQGLGFVRPNACRFRHRATPSRAQRAFRTLKAFQTKARGSPRERSERGVPRVSIPPPPTTLKGLHTRWWR